MPDESLVRIAGIPDARDQQESPVEQGEMQL
jgi:hypothetical protein